MTPFAFLVAGPLLLSAPSAADAASDWLLASSFACRVAPVRVGPLPWPLELGCGDRCECCGTHCYYAGYVYPHYGDCRFGDLAYLPPPPWLCEGCRADREAVDQLSLGPEPKRWAVTAAPCEAPAPPKSIACKATGRLLHRTPKGFLPREKPGPDGSVWLDVRTGEYGPLKVTGAKP
jgi:hypothetical protein